MMELYLFLEVAVLSLFIVLILIRLAYTWHSSYWKRKGLPFLKSPYGLGELESILASKVYTGIRIKNAYNRIKENGWKHAGVHIVGFSLYMPVTPLLIKRILQQDFDHFTEKALYYNEKDDPLSANLFSIGGQTWRYIRTKLSPSFSAGKIRMLFDGLVQCGYQMQDAIDELCDKGEILEAKNIAACYTIDNIGSCVYGLDCNSFKSPNSEFRIHARKIFESTPTTRILKIVLASFAPKIARFFRITLFPSEIREFFVDIVKETIESRKSNGIFRNDFIQSLMKLHNVEDIEGGFTIEQLSAHAFIFFAAGFETSSTTISFCLYELSINEDIQEKARFEILDILGKRNGKLEYDAVMEMKYLDQVIDETLRKYPSVSFVNRTCSKDYKIADTDVVIPKGMLVTISILGLHKDPEYFPDPEKFDPERFSYDRKKNIRPYTYLPFGEGPRICIGLRFGLLQVKLGIICLLSRYKLSLNTKTEEPLTMEPCAFPMYSKNGIYLNVEKLV